MEGYGIKLNAVTYAPSVADERQGFGIGNQLYHFILEYLKLKGISRLILWGGVQKANKNAIHYYTRNGFEQLGIFQYNGSNIDMVATLI